LGYASLTALEATNRIIKESTNVGFPVNVALRKQYKLNELALKEDE